MFNLKDRGSRLTRWRLKLKEYQYTVHFKTGANNTNADAPSRIHQVTTRSQQTNRFTHSSDNSSKITDSHLFSETSDTQELPEIIDSQSSTDVSDTQESLKTTNPQISLETPDTQRNKTANRTIKEPMVITTTSSRPFEKIFMDIVGPLLKSHQGNVFILTLQDDLSKFTVPMYNHEANTVTQHFVTQFVCLHGLPKTLVTDCGTEFLSRVFKEVCRLLKIKQTFTTPYHPQSNGSLEKSHRTLDEYLRSFAEKDPKNLDTYVPFAMFCHNSTEHFSTKFQPYPLVYGHQIVVNSFTRYTEPQYNYEDYYLEMKKQMQEAHQLART